MAATSTTDRWTEEELRRKVGQLFIVGFHGHTPSEDVKTLITKYHVGAVVLFGRNVASGPQLSSLTTSLQSIATSASHAQPLFIAIDQEGGLVTRIKAPIAAQLPGAMSLGATGSTDYAYKAASATAETLKSFGINMNYAPIADINSEPKNPVIGVRSPSDDPETVGRFVSAAVRGLREGGIAPCVKHFPGHGDTAVDSHYGLPVIRKTKAELVACELVPFRRAAIEGIEAVMTAHIALPALGGEEGLPASLDPMAIKILREDLRYDGLVVSDCLEMDGVRATFGTENGAVMALRAGTDNVMICHTMSAQVGAIEKVVEAVKSGEISQETLQKSFDRLTKLKERFLKLTIAPDASFDRAAMNQRHAALAAEIYAKSATVVRSSPGSFPISKADGKKVVFLSPGKTPLSGGAVDSGEEKTREPYISADLVSVLREQYSATIHKQYFDEESISESILSEINNADTVILCTRNGSLSPYQRRMGLELGAKLGNKLVVIATCDPYDFLEDSAEVKNYITIYEPTVPAFKAAVDIMFGNTTAQGRLPVQQAKESYDIQPLDADRDIVAMSELWHKVLPAWDIPTDRLAYLLSPPLARQNGRHFVIYAKRSSAADQKQTEPASPPELLAFLISYITSGHAKIAVVAVSTKHRNQGLGTALLTHAKSILLSDPKTQTLGIGSIYPRFWPGVPLSFGQPVLSFFAHRGFHPDNTKAPKDMFRDLRNYQHLDRVLQDVKTHGLTFKPWSKEMEAECIEAQKRFFDPGWAVAYQGLAHANLHHEVMIAFDTQGRQVGWTLMCAPEVLLPQSFAFLPLVGRAEGVDGGKIGLIACVGVDKSVRGKGIGLALTSMAMADMKRRGMDGVLIDWVVLKGFYEKLGVEVKWEYGGFDW